MGGSCLAGRFTEELSEQRLGGREELRVVGEVTLR